MKAVYAVAVVAVCAVAWTGFPPARADGLLDQSLDIMYGATPKNDGGSLLPCGGYEETVCEGL